MAATLVVEDGTGLANANSWVSVADSKTYHESMGNTDWTGTTPDNDLIVALIRGAAYVGNHYISEWPGSKVNGRAQSMQWPRENAYDTSGEEILVTEIPIEVKQAQMEAALRELREPGSLSPDVLGSEVVTLEKVGPITIEYDDDSGTAGQTPTFSTIDSILSGIIGRKSNTRVTFPLRA